MDLVDVTLLVTRTLEEIGVAYAIGGSLASSLHGMPRATRDADVVADLFPEHVLPLIDGLGGQFYVEESAVRQAIAARRSFNLIHLESMFKVDVFVSKGDDWSREQIRRRERHTLGQATQETAFFTAPEDTVLAKLRWFREGGEASDRQWSDLVGVIKVQGPRFDRAYLSSWAERLGLADLAARAIRDADRER